MTAPHPQVRRRARERALQFLFGLDFTRAPWQDAIEGFWRTYPARPNVKTYAETLIRGVFDNLDTLDRQIDAALQRWTPGRVGRIERCLLRIALFEMRYAPDVPDKVAINEALEIAKRYAWDEAPRFINGVLDRLRVPDE